SGNQQPSAVFLGLSRFLGSCGCNRWPASATHRGAGLRRSAGCGGGRNAHLVAAHCRAHRGRKMSWSYLWVHRERPRVLSTRWTLVWGKRALRCGGMLRLTARANWLRWRGATIGALSVVEKCRVEGDPRKLSMGSESVIGRDAELMLHDRIHIGNRVVINARAVLLTASHGVCDPAWATYSRPIVIDDYAWIATGAML